MKKQNLIYIIAVLLILLFPLVGLPLFGSDWSTETTSLAEAPSLKTEEGKLNTAYLSDAGAYFEDHFALRSDLITANSLLQAKVFRTSSNRKITVGSDNWLYFNGTMDDYQGQNLMSERELYNIAYNLKKINDYYTLLGKQVIFTIAPNKNSLYPEQMPSNVLKGEEQGNVERLIPYLEDFDISYVDLFDLFEQQEDCLYFARDSHWNSKGAALVYNALMKAAGYSGYETYEGVEPEAQKSHSGDLAEMLYPEKVDLETDYVYQMANNWSYVETETEDSAENADDETGADAENDRNMDSYIQTVNPKGTGSMYIFRDSFGASLVPFFAEACNTVTFSWLLPYNLTDAVLQQADTVIIECVERNIDYIAEYGATMPALPAVAVLPDATEEDKQDAEADSQDVSADILVEKNGAYFEVTGSVEGDGFQADTDLLIRIKREDGSMIGIYEPFYTSTVDDSGKRVADNGFLLDLMGEDYVGNLKLELFAGKGEDMKLIKTVSVDFDTL